MTSEGIVYGPVDRKTPDLKTIQGLNNAKLTLLSNRQQTYIHMHIPEYIHSYTSIGNTRAAFSLESTNAM